MTPTFDDLTGDARSDTPLIDQMLKDRLRHDGKRLTDNNSLVGHDGLLKRMARHQLYVYAQFGPGGLVVPDAHLYSAPAAFAQVAITSDPWGTVRSNTSDPLRAMKARSSWNVPTWIALGIFAYVGNGTALTEYGIAWIGHTALMSTEDKKLILDAWANAEANGITANDLVDWDDVRTKKFGSMTQAERSKSLKTKAARRREMREAYESRLDHIDTRLGDIEASLVNLAQTVVDLGISIGSLERTVRNGKVPEANGTDMSHTDLSQVLKLVEAVKVLDEVGLLHGRSS